MFSLDRSLKPSALSTLGAALGEKTEAEIVVLRAKDGKIEGGPVLVLIVLKNLGFGVKDSEVLKLQSLLQSLGFFPKGETPTGYYGSVTQKAVEDFPVRQDEHLLRQSRHKRLGAGKTADERGSSEIDRHASHGTTFQ